MKDSETEQPRDELEIEITSLDKPDATTGPEPLQRLLRLRSLPRYRWGLTLITTLIVCISLVALVVTTPARNLIVGAFVHPTPTLVPGVDLFYVQGVPPWARLAVDGMPAHLPSISQDPPLRLAPGRHTLTWHAAPFLKQACTISVPPNYGLDTCSFLQSGLIHLNTGVSVWVINFSISLDSLPSTQQPAFMQAIQAAIDAAQLTDTVRPGERYVISSHDPACKPAPGEPLCYATAKQPLKATLSWQMDTDAASNEPCINVSSLGCTFFTQNCHRVCIRSTGTGNSLNAQALDVVVPVRTTWTFATLDGKVLESQVPDNTLSIFATGDPVTEASLWLRVVWDGSAWHASMLTNPPLNPACAAAQQEVQPLDPPPVATGTATSPQWRFVSGATPAAGCLAIGTPRIDALSTPTASFTIYCLHRFGVLLTANDAAQRAWPYLPHADAYEQGLARQLAATFGGSIIINGP
ncbi:MAG TPA: hypothetical protein VKY19_16820 [Ktedonosporobacter sp.]|jgi:hypothetical protein|nr:hypothetical protein [Ktedonosporobacter sp.]